MDFTRFTYKAPCRFTVGGPLVDIHWYWADPEASVYLLPHAFPAMTGFRQFKFSDGVGEMWERWPRKASKFGPAFVEGTAVDGTPADFLGQRVFGPILWSQLPPCLGPVQFFDNTIAIEGNSRVPFVPTLLIDAKSSARQFASIRLDGIGEPRLKETACIGFMAEGDPFQKGVLQFGASIKLPSESAKVAFLAETSKTSPPSLPPGFEAAVVNLDAATGPKFPPAAKTPLELWVEAMNVGAEEDALIAIHCPDLVDLPGPERVEVLIYGEGFPFGSGSGSGSGPPGGPGDACEDGLVMDNGVTYTVDVPPGHPDQWFKILIPVGWTADCAYLTNSGPDRSISWFHGACDDLHLIRGTFEHLAAFPYGPAPATEWVIAYVNNFNGSGNYSIRITINP